MTHLASGENFLLAVLVELHDRDFVAQLLLVPIVVDQGVFRLHQVDGPLCVLVHDAVDDCSRDRVDEVNPGACV